MKITRHNLFTVPVTYYKDFMPLNLANNVKEYIMEVKLKNTASYSALIGDAATSYNTEKSTEFIQEVVLNVAGCADFHNNIQKCINDFTSSYGIPRCTFINSWFNIQQPASILKRHSHISGEVIPAVSGALYINIDEESSDIFNPSIGDLILFPSWLIHSSDKINLTRNRIVISFNARQL